MENMMICSTVVLLLLLLVMVVVCSSGGGGGVAGTTTSNFLCAYSINPRKLRPIILSYVWQMQGVEYFNEKLVKGEESCQKYSIKSNGDEEKCV